MYNTKWPCTPRLDERISIECLTENALAELAYQTKTSKVLLTGSASEMDDLVPSFWKDHCIGII